MRWRRERTLGVCFFFSSRRRHTRCSRDWSSDVCSSDLPVTEQERWEEASGYSPSTLASNIAALIGAAWFARERGDEAVATMLEEYADFLECHIEAWTVTTEGALVPGVQRHYKIGRAHV